MISEYIELIASFKEYQISKLIEKIHLKIFEALNSPKFNPRIAPYFKEINKTGIPFTDFSLDPDNISQIKKIINALHHARLTFLDLENVEISANIGTLPRSLNDLALLYRKTIHQAYQASYLLTHMDIDIRDMFSEEFALILPYITKLEALAKKHSLKTKEIAAQLKDFPLSYKMGEVTGITIEQMQPNSGDLNYSLLTQFSAELPEYIDKLTQYISQYSSQIIKKEPNLNKEQIEELQNAAFTLLNDLENLKGNSLFLSFKVLNYIHIISNIITLSMSALKQVGHLSESSQDVIRDNLTQLKYSYLTTLFGLVDKIEDNAMLQPGTLSIPLMEKVKPYYESLIYYVSNLVDFQAKGEELLSIEDSRFLALRLERTYKRIDAANKSLFKIKKAQEAFIDFYLILDDPQYRNLALHQLPTEIKTQLVKHYKLVKPYLLQIDPDFNELVTKSLLGGESWSSFLSRPWRWAKGTLPANHVSFVLGKKSQLQHFISKKIATQEFHIDLNTDLIKSVQKQTNLVLFPYNEKSNVYTIDESTALNLPPNIISELEFRQETEHNLLINQEKLTADQALDLYQWYRNKHNKFMIAKNAYLEFITLLNSDAATKGDVLHLDKLSDEIKAKCRNLYNLFQPYFIDGMPKTLRASALNFDSLLVHALSNKEKIPKRPLGNIFAKMNEHFQTYFTQVDLNWNKQSRAYLRWAKEQYESENEASPLTYETNRENRAHHVISHTHYSTFIHKFRVAVFQITSRLNQSMQTELTPQPYGMPFPELQDENQILAQSKQVLAIKKLFNSLYHAEEIILELEQLTNRQYESKYVYHLLQAYGHIHNIIRLTQDLAHDPHFELIGRQLLEKAQTLFAAIQEHGDAYKVGPEEIATGDEAVQYNGLWYTLNTFFIFPKHLRSLNNSNYLTAEELTQLHKDAKNSTIGIERIINSSDSYFKLFLQTPTMYRLYRDLTNKLNEFISTSHDTMMDNLDKLRSEFITPMLIEADLWEDKLGLKLGILSDTLKKVTDEYYKGLLHPLGLHSKKHIDLICDKTPIIKRIELTDKKIKSATEYIEKLDSNYKHVEHLYTLIKEHANALNQSATIDTEYNESQSKLVHAYKKALPKLVKLQKKLGLKPSDDPDNDKFDEFFNARTTKYEPKLNQINSLLIASHHYYLGIKSTYQMQLSTAKEKLTYLTAVQGSQEKEDQQFILEYTTESFNKQLEVLCNRHIGLQYTDKEYRRKLKDYLLTFAQEIISQAKTAEDINLTVRTLLKTKIGLFEKDHFAPHYHLDTVRVALAQFKNYFSLSNSSDSIFENEHTLERKSEYVNKLIDIAENEQLTIQERLDQMHFNVIKNPNFERIILAYKQVDYFSFAYLMQCFITLLEAFYLYTPPRKALYKGLLEAVNNKPQMTELTNRFGLFATQDTVIHEIQTEEPTIAIEPSKQENNEVKKSLAEEWQSKGRKNMLMFIQQMNNHDETAPEHSAVDHSLLTPITIAG
ncbi:protein SdhA [Legionella fallonii]|uniref:SdhA, substrate of the Dot/Icm system n=1 Tax=Legionella fallonii LLAP-10 TaxID=1212491 RepID=A0A098G9G3_9GAMM|nr:protein SdhA [Legionella fallonii]CEG58105.1 SdhA, substrate of the Dot/Icm system [Legionella fallonii LLAP-10]